MVALEQAVFLILPSGILRHPIILVDFVLRDRGEIPFRIPVLLPIPSGQNEFLECEGCRPVEVVALAAQSVEGLGEILLTVMTHEVEPSHLLKTELQSLFTEDGLAELILCHP